MTSSRIITLGSINTDLVIKGPRLPAPGETVLGGEFYTAAGGKGANQAVAAARASHEPVVMIGAVGDDDFGRVALSEGKNLVEAARWASVAAGLSVTRQGAQPSLPSRDEIEAELLMLDRE